jgi:hypothetical protein
MSAHTDEGDEMTGASRRDVLRGGAIGMGALVGAMALVNANEVSSEAKRATSRTLWVGFAGNGLAASNKVPLQSFALGGEVNGSPDPLPVSLTLNTNKYSGKLLQVYAEAITLSKIVISEYHADVQGVEKLYLTVTLTSARITSFHTSVHTTASSIASSTRDSLTAVWGGTMTVLRHDNNSSYQWALPT